MEEVVTEANASLKRTPDLLPVLKEVGVVDSGGQGLVFVYEGFLAVLKGEALPVRSAMVQAWMTCQCGTSHECTRAYEYGRYRVWLLYGIHGPSWKMKNLPIESV